MVCITLNEMKTKGYFRIWDEYSPQMDFDEMMDYYDTVDNAATHVDDDGTTWTDAVLDNLLGIVWTEMAKKYPAELKQYCEMLCHQMFDGTDVKWTVH